MENKNVVELSNVMELAKAIAKEQNKIAWKNVGIAMGAFCFAGFIYGAAEKIRESIIAKKLNKNEEE